MGVDTSQDPMPSSGAPLGLRTIPKPMGLVGAGSALNSMGLSFLWSLTTLYVHVHLGAALTEVGVILTAQQGAGLVGSLLGGALSDRLGARVPLVLSAAIGTASLAAIALDGALLVYAVAAVVAGVSVGITFACLNAAAPRAWPGGGRDAFNIVYVSFNLGVAAGPVLAGVLASINFRFTFLVGALGLFLFFLLVVLSFRGEAFARLPTAHRTFSRTRLSDLTGLGWPVWLLVGGLLLDWVVYAQWFTLVPDYLHVAGVPIPLYSALWTVNGVLILAGQPLMQRLVARFPRVKTQMLLGSGLFLLEVLLLAAFRTYPFYVAAMVCSTAGEMLVWPAVPAAADARTRPERRGLVQGIVSMAGFAGRTVGPLAGVTLAAALAVGPVFGVLGLVILTGGLLYAGYVQADRDGSAQTPQTAN
ncbi:MAG: MFS transporter [Clostridia bacterium]